MEKEITIKSMAKLPGTTFCEMRLNGNLRRGSPKNKKRPASTIEVSVPEAWIDDLFRYFGHHGMGEEAKGEYFLMRVIRSEIPEHGE